MSEAEAVPLTGPSNGTVAGSAISSTDVSSSTAGVYTTTVRSKDDKYHRLVLDANNRKLEFTLLQGGQPSSHQLTLGLEEVISVRSDRVKLRGQLPTKNFQEKLTRTGTPSPPNAIFIYYAYRRNVYVWRVREAAVYFTSTAEKKQWEELLQKTLQQQPYRPRKLLVFVNPFGGKRKANAIYKNQVEPLFQLANVECQVVPTERANHAYEYIGEIDPETWASLDGIVSVGGDGLFNEILCAAVIRTQAEHKKDITDVQVDSLVTPRIRFGIIGAGSANSIVSSVHGVDDCPTAAVHIAIGSKCAVDCCLVHEGNNLLRISANAISYGWLGDVLRDSESYRCMGPIRYQWSALLTTIRHPTYFGRISFALSNPKEDAKEVPKLPECIKPCGICEGVEPVDPNYPYHWQTDYTHIICCVIPCVSPFTPYGLAPFAGVGDGSMDLALLPKVSRIANLQIMRKVAMYGGKGLLPLRNDLHVFRVSRWVFTPGSIVLGETDDGKKTEGSPLGGTVIKRITPQGAWNLDGEILPQPQNTALQFRLHPRLINYFGRELDLDDPRYQKCFCCYQPRKFSKIVILD
ncbi:Ceramide kinase [Aphelenchoides avenae]|nr:Ceramide kinase [Aphelenchus avenae]